MADYQDIGVHDPVTGGSYKLSPEAAKAFIAANQDYKSVYGHDIPVASAYRDPQRNHAAGGSPTSNHLHGNSLDIDRNALAQVAPFLQLHGFSALGGTYHNPATGQTQSEDNHFDFGAHHPKGKTSTAQAKPSAQPDVSVEPTPIPDGAAVVPVNGLGLDIPTRQQSQTSNQALMDQTSIDIPQVQTPAPTPQPAPATQHDWLTPEDKAFIEKQGKPATGVQGLINAGIDYAKGVAHQITQIPEALGAEAQQFTQDPLAGVKAYAATGAGLAQGGRDLLQMPADLVNAGASAWMGVPFNKENNAYNLPNVSDIPGIGQALANNMQAHPVFSTVGNLAGQSLLPESAGLLREKPPVAAPVDLALDKPFSLQAPIQTEADLVRRAAVPTQREQLAQMLQNIEQGKSTPDLRSIDNHLESALYKNPALVNPENLHTPQEVADLKQAFENRLKPENPGQIVTPGDLAHEASPKAAQDILGPSRIENNGPIDLALKTGERKTLVGKDGEPIRAEEISKRDTPPDLANADNRPTESRPAAEVPDLINPATDRPFSAKPDASNVLEFPGKQEPAGEILGPSGKPLIQPKPEAEPVKTGALSSTISGVPQAEPTQTAAPTLNPAKPITQEMIDSAEKAKHTLVTIAEAERHLKQHQPESMPHFLNAVEAGKNNQTLGMKHAPLDQGGRVINDREVSPVGFTMHTISGSREVTNLRAQFEGDMNKVRDNLVQRLHDAGVKVSADEQRINGNRGDITRMNALADKLPAEKRTHVYVMDHNFGETARKEGPYGFRRLDRIQESSLTGRAQELPAGTEQTNKIAPAFQSLRDFMASSDAPVSLKRVSKQLDSGNISKRSLKDLQTAYESLSPEKLAELCKRFGL